MINNIEIRVASKRDWYQTCVLTTKYLRKSKSTDPSSIINVIKWMNRMIEYEPSDMPYKTIDIDVLIQKLMKKHDVFPCRMFANIHYTILNKLIKCNISQISFQASFYPDAINHKFVKFVSYSKSLKSLCLECSSKHGYTLKMKRHHVDQLCLALRLNTSIESLRLSNQSKLGDIEITQIILTLMKNKQIPIKTIDIYGTNITLKTIDKLFKYVDMNHCQLKWIITDIIDDRIDKLHANQSS
jgi:hypothetical protein